MATNKALVQAYFDALIAGGLPDELLTDDMTAWTTLGGDTEGKRYQAMAALLRRLCPEHLEFDIRALTGEDDRVVAEVISNATLLTGEPYSNTYVFVFHLRDGRIAHVAEHFNALIVMEKLTPLMKQLTG